jgi:hypothetical protein
MNPSIKSRDCEGRRFVTNGSTICPHPRNCDIQEGETYADYVRRHCLDHQLGSIPELEDAERNLGCWCLYYFARHIIGNASLGTGTRIVAHWEPCWEDAEYLNNWIFSENDTEQNAEWDDRTFVLKPFAERDNEHAVYKRFKKLTKVRDTQKTSWGKALVTYRVVRAYFVEDRPNYRVLIISGTSTLARDHYLTPLTDMWENHANLQRLYGTTLYTQRHHALQRKIKAGKHVDPDELENETRKVGLLARGSKPKDTLRARWVVRQKNSSGLSAITVKVAGMETTTSGNRWDLVDVDDPVVPENVGTEPLRKKVKRKIADLRKQGDADSEFVYFNTPYHIDDASAQIDSEQGHQYHIVYRPGMWFDTHTKEPRYYWQYNALEPGELVPNKPQRNAVWPASRIEEERDQPDFHSQIMLRARDEAGALFDEKDFTIVDLKDCPIEVRAGLYGNPITEEEKAYITADGLEIHSYLLVDPAGNETGSNRNAETAIVGARIARDGIYFCYLRAARMTASEEENAVFDGAEQIAAEKIHFEIVSAGKKHVVRNFQRFQVEKSRELGRVIMLPFVWRDAASTKSKEIRVPQMQPYAKQGRIKIVKQAAPIHVVRKFIGQFTDWGQAPLKDMADAASMIQFYIRRDEYAAAEEEKPQDPAKFGIDDEGIVHIPASFIFSQIDKPREDSALPWGQRGMSRG